MKILTAGQMSEVDRMTTETYRVPSLLLMENAGRSVADCLDEACADLRRKSICILCGKGNNGGDGFVVARYLALRGCKPEILLFADPSQLKGDALANWEMARALDVPIRTFADVRRGAAFLRKASNPDVLVDALFGTGLSKPIGREFKPVIDWINGAAERALIASVDIPSGLFADSGVLPGPAVRADMTITFTALKPALVLRPAAECAGKVTVVAIGSPQALLENPEYRMELIDRQCVKTALPRRLPESHKGSYGHLFILAGSRGKSGAALMTGLAALRSGAGLVTLLLPQSLQRSVVGKIPELMTEFIPETPQGSPDFAAAPQVTTLLHDADALVVGPGLTTAESTQALVRDLVTHSHVPVVLDADGINAFPSHPQMLRNENNCPIVITPHPGEMARLLGTGISAIQKKRIETARETSVKHSFFTILKGNQTIIASPSGLILINSTGNPGMATGGTGDVLAGMVGSLVGRWNRRFGGADERALATHLAAAVFLHGLAGDMAAEQMGMESLIATDLVPNIPGAFKRVLEAE
jgi:NAD(P)H-hydrate epimerase